MSGTERKGMPDLAGYAIFAAVVEAGSFTAAARRGGLSKSAVSKAVARLEDRLGARLLNRTTRRLSLTEAGHAFYQSCVRIIAEAEEAERAAGRLQAVPRGTLRVNAPVSFGTLHLGPVLPAFMRRYPEIVLDVTFNDRFVDLIEEGFDVAVRIGTLADSSLRARRLAEARHVLCAAPDYWARHGRPRHPADLARHRCLTYAYLSTGSQWLFAGPEGAVRVRVAGGLNTNNGEVLRAAAVAGAGVALLPSFICWRELAAGTLEEVLPDYAAPGGGVFAVFPPGRHVPAKVRRFVDFLAERFGPHPYWERSGRD